MQVVDVVAANAKLQWLLARLPGFIDAGDVLVFANQKANVDELTAKLQAASFKWVLHCDTVALTFPAACYTKPSMITVCCKANLFPLACMITILTAVAFVAGPLQSMATWTSTRAWERLGTSRRDAITSWWRQT